MTEISLPDSTGRIHLHRLREPLSFQQPEAPFNRVAYSAAHVVADPMREQDPWSNACIDWDRTIEYRRHLWRLGLGVAEAMDTAQRGMGLDWTSAQQLIRLSLDAGRDFPGAIIACGAGTDHLHPAMTPTLDDVIRAYEEQCAFIEKCGGRIILMASRALAAVAKTPEDYARVYGRVLENAKDKVILHWLGDMFDAALSGYWGSRNDSEAMATAIDLIAMHSDKVDGIKISLLDRQKEIEMRRRLPPEVKMYTGDDFNYPDLIEGEPNEPGVFSHALLGIFDAIAPAASQALGCLQRGDTAGYRAILEPTVPLSRRIFAAPTRFYKTGIVFMAYLNGHQDHFTMLGGQQSARSILHLSEIFRLADAAGLLRNPDLATKRMRDVLSIHGVT